MALLDFLRGGSAQKKDFSPAQWTTISGSSLFPFRGFKSGQQRLAEYKGWVFACVEVRAEAVGNIGLQLFKGDEEIFDHPLLDLLNKVNPRTTKKQLFKGTQAFMDLEGDSFWFLARENDGKGAIKEIYLMRPDRLTIIPSEDESDPFSVKGYEYRLGSESVTFQPNQIMHVPNFNPLGEHPYPHKGMSTLEAAANAVEMDNQSRLWNYSFFKNSARPDGLVISEEELSDENRERMKAQINSEHQGAENAHKWALLEGKFDWKETQRTQKDMDFIEQRKFSRDEILALFRVPKPAIGIVEDVTVSNAEATDYIFASRTIKPLMENIVDAINEFIVPEFGDDLELRFVDPTPENEERKALYYEKALDKWMTRNEIRAAEGLEPTRDGDKIFGQLSQIPIDQTQPDTQKSVKRGKETPQKKEATASKKDDDVRFVITLDKKDVSLSDDAREKYVTAWKQHINLHTQAFIKKLRDYFTNQEKEVMANLERELGEKKITRKAIEDILFDDERAINSGISLVTPFAENWMEEAGERARTLVGSGVPFDPSSPEAVKFLQERAKFFAETITKKTREDLFATLKEGEAAKEGVFELSNRVADVYRDARDYRTDRIARTEVSAASNEGSVLAYKEAGIEKHEWIVVAPEDADCQVNAGSVVKIGKQFPSGDTQPPLHPNCVCTTVPVFD